MDVRVKELLNLRPYLRKYAISLMRKADGADDLVQETCLRAIAGHHTFKPGTNFQAWVTVIMRNTFRTMRKKERKERYLMKSFRGQAIDIAVDAKEQFANLAFKEAIACFDTLPRDQRETLDFVAMQGMSYEDIAKSCDIAVGTVKSRVSRAREKMRDHRPLDY